MSALVGAAQSHARAPMHAHRQAFTPEEDAARSCSECTQRAAHRCSICGGGACGRHVNLHACRHVHACGHEGVCPECGRHDGTHTSHCRRRTVARLSGKAATQREQVRARALEALDFIVANADRVRSLLQTTHLTTDGLCWPAESMASGARGIQQIYELTGTAETPWRGPEPCTCTGTLHAYCHDALGADHPGEAVTGASRPGPDPVREPPAIEERAPYALDSELVRDPDGLATLPLFSST